MVPKKILLKFHSTFEHNLQKLILRQQRNFEALARVQSKMDVNNVQSIHALQWFPQKITNVLNGQNTLRYVCLVLNREIRVPPDVVCNIWENAQLRCMVDGGSNRWRQFLQDHCNNRKMKMPDLITGDFDSISDESLEYFKNTKRQHTPDQDDTDFTKAIGVLRPYLEKQQIENIIVFHDTSGRFDHIMANINTLFKVQSSSLTIYLLSSNSMTWLLRPGKHSIWIPTELVENQRWCALIPIGAPARNVTTKGLRWDLCSEELKFGGLVSSSNTYASENIQIETESCLIWSMGLFCFDDSC